MKIGAWVVATLVATALLPAPGASATLPDYAKNKLDAHISGLDALQSLLDLFMGRSVTNPTVRWNYFSGNAYSLAGILANSTISSGGGGDATSLLFFIPLPGPGVEIMSNASQCPDCARNISRGLAAIANNSTAIYGDAAGTTGRARVFREYRALLESTAPENAARNLSRLVPLESSLLRDGLMVYTEIQKQMYRILGI